jgi:trafficking protein particle complex subunit 6
MSFESVMPPYNVTDPSATFLNSSCLDFLLIELVPMTYRITNELDARSPPPLSGLPAAATEKPSHTDAGSSSAVGPARAAPSSGAFMNGRRMDEEDERDAVFYRLESLGYRVGEGLVER